MTRTILSLAILIGTVMPSAAHPDAHSDLSGWQSAVAHLLGSPFHVLTLLAVVSAAVAGAVYWKRRRHAHKG